MLTLNRGNVSLFTLGMEQREVHPISHREEGNPSPYMHKAGCSPTPFGGVGTSPPFKHRGNTLPHFSPEKESLTIFRHSGGSLSFFPGRMGNPAFFRYARKSCQCLTYTRKMSHLFSWYNRKSCPFQIWDRKSCPCLTYNRCHSIPLPGLTGSPTPFRYGTYNRDMSHLFSW